MRVRERFGGAPGSDAALALVLSFVLVLAGGLGHRPPPEPDPPARPPADLRCRGGKGRHLASARAN
jgi:hypothetical protein